MIEASVYLYLKLTSLSAAFFWCVEHVKSKEQIIRCSLSNIMTDERKLLGVSESPLIGS